MGISKRWATESVGCWKGKRYLCSCMGAGAGAGAEEGAMGGRRDGGGCEEWVILVLT